MKYEEKQQEEDDMAAGCNGDVLMWLFKLTRISARVLDLEATTVNLSVFTSTEYYLSIYY